MEWAGSEADFNIGDEVFGFTMFGAYSSKLLVPCRQVRRVPKIASLPAIAGVPAVAATALHAIALSGGWPNQLQTVNRAVLIHSAAGGVGSMLIQMCKILGYSPIVAVVGSSHKVDFCSKLGADIVIDKSNFSSSSSMWSKIHEQV